MFEKLLIANRGEIALRIHRACQEMGIKTVAIHSTADQDAMHVRLADEAVCIGPPAPKDSYLNTRSILTAALLTGVDAIHPGVGFLSENARFAEMVEEHGITFVGPTPEHMRVMGDKIAAKQAAKELGIPVVSGSDGEVQDYEQAKRVGREIGYPLIIKAAAGGGGRGMKVAQAESELAEALSLCQSEAQAAFGDSAVYMERYMQKPRHIEVQVLGDGQGDCLHLGERDCSIQRRHQKVVEETASPGLDETLREEVCRRSAEAMKKMHYRGAGTIEYLYEDGEFAFIEMNTRLQVEHPITEMVTGIDLVREQIIVASGERLSFAQSDINPTGHAIECRITAENPVNFMPTPGRITDYHAPGGLGVRVDSHLYAGYNVPPFYDSLIAKLVVAGTSRSECLMRLQRALKEFVIGGIDTTLPLHRQIIEQPAFIDGDYNIHWLERWMQETQAS